MPGSKRKPHAPNESKRPKKPLQPEPDRQPTPAPIAAQANLGRRLLAFLTDGLLVTVITVVGFLAAGFLTLGMTDANDDTISVIASLVGSLLAFFGFAWRDAWSTGSPGKRLLRLRAVRLDGQPLNRSTSFKRNWMFGLAMLFPLFLFLSEEVGYPFEEIMGLPGLVSSIGLVLGFVEGLLVLVSPPQRQRLGDRLAGTLILPKSADALPASHTPPASAPAAPAPNDPAPLGRRGLAFLIDVGLAYTLLVLLRETNIKSDSPQVLLVLLLLLFILCRDNLPTGSPGKWLMGLRPARTDGRPANLGLSVRRNWMFGFAALAVLPYGFVPIGKLSYMPLDELHYVFTYDPLTAVGFLASVLAIVFLLMESLFILARPDRRRWGDLLAGTTVVRRPAP